MSNLINLFGVMFKEKNYWLVDEKVGTNSYCRCGFSKNFPLCDNSHENLNSKPYVVIVKENRRVAICGCKKSTKMPYCDGKHGK